MTERTHKEYYLRTIDQQMLDALLRIEEILLRAHPAPVVIEPAPKEDLEEDVEDAEPAKKRGKSK